MIDRFDTIRDIDDSTPQGKLLLMALAALTSIDEEDIKTQKWGGMVHPDDALERLVDLTNSVYYEEEWKSEKTIKERDKKIESILK